MKVISKELTPQPENDNNYEAIEAQIKKLWKDKIYLPLLKELGEKQKILNARDGLLEAIRTGRIQFYRGEFTGRFSALISKEIKALGGTWNRQTRTWKLPQVSLPMEVRNAISASEVNFQTKINALDRKLAQILPEEIAGSLKISKFIDSTLWKVDRDFKASLRKLAISPQLTDAQKKRIVDEWQLNLKLPIVNWTEKEVEKLRKEIQESVFAGNRRDALVKIIKGSHQSSLSKAKFIARQETRLLLTKFKQTQYQDAGVDLYKWRCANRPHQPAGAPYKKGEVRHDHAILENKIFKWDDSFEVDLNGRRKAGGLQKPNGKDNPGQDYNCRCFAIPIVQFKVGASK